MDYLGLITRKRRCPWRLGLALIISALSLAGCKKNGSSSGTATAISSVRAPNGRTSTTTGSLATARRFATAALLPDGMVLIAGGAERVNGNTPLMSAELYQ